MFQRIVIATGLVSAVILGVAGTNAAMDVYHEHQCYTVKGGTFYGPIGNPDASGPNFCFDADKRRLG